MQHAFRMRRCHSRAQLERDLHTLVDRESSDSTKQCGKVFPIHVLHRQVQLALSLADVVDAAHIRMRDLSRKSHFITQSVSSALVDSDGSQEFQGHYRLIQL